MIKATRMWGRSNKQDIAFSFLDRGRGFTPGIFTDLINGYFLDAYNEKIGHQIVFIIMFGFALIGSIASYKLHKHSKQISN